MRALEVESLVQLHLGKQVIDVFSLVIELICVPFAEDAVLVVHHLFALIQERDGKDLVADWALQVAHTVVVLICGIVGAHLVETVPAGELLDLFLLHAVAAHTLLALDAKVHLVTYEKPRASTLVVHIRRLIRRQLKHRAHFSILLD